jgi:hypothetical protein
MSPRLLALLRAPKAHTTQDRRDAVGAVEAFAPFSRTSRIGYGVGNGRWIERQRDRRHSFALAV